MYQFVRALGPSEYSCTITLARPGGTRLAPGPPPRMKLIRLPCVLLLVALAAAGCANTADTSQQASTVDNGTTLTATATASAPVRSGDGTAGVAFSGTVTSTGSVDSVAITATVDGGTATQVGTREPADFSGSGRDKTADYSVSRSLANGTHEVVLCFTQSDAQGRDPKQFCTDPIPVVVACEDCAKTGPFGDIVGNPDLCNGNGPPHVPIHVSGNLGDSAALAVDGPGGYHLDATMDHAGHRCIYQYNRDTAGNGGAGTYTFSVTGANGTSLSFTADLKCH